MRRPVSSPAVNRSDLRVGAVQLQPCLGDVDANLAACEPLVAEAALAGARIVVLPEFFTTGMAYLPSMRTGTVHFDGSVVPWLVDQAARHGVALGGSFLCRDRDGEVRNAFVLADRDGVIGRHDKDLPTMWENAFYARGSDDGVIELRDGLRVGVALCWELMRSQTVRRLCGRVDLVLAGSAWWSVPEWRPRSVTRRWEAANRRTATGAAPAFARFVGAPVVHASHCGPVSCPALGLGARYEGFFEGPTGVYAADGAPLAERAVGEGPGVVVADVRPGAVEPTDPVPDRFWLHRRGVLPAFAWTWQGMLGRREYARGVRGAAAPR
jgi:predicted amidohydrolase